MANFMELLQSQLTDGVLDMLGQQTGAASKEQTNTAANVALSTLMGALNKNASKPQGLQGLMGALENDHDGGILDDITSLLGGQKNNRQADGMGILSHLLGGSNIFNVVEMISKSSGLNRNGSMNMLMKLAPMVLGVLGKQKKQTNMNQNNLLDFLQGSVQTQAARQPAPQSLITKLLDSDGDGSVMDEMATMGFKVLGGLFK